MKRLNREAVHISGLFLSIYFALGALYPLLSHYLKQIGMSGTQIGMIVSVGPIIALVAQPLWGMLCDRFQTARLVLRGILLAAACIMLFLAQKDTFIGFVMLYAVLHVFQSGVVPVSDGIGLGYAARAGVDFGWIRQWGALGFAFATFVAGLLAEAISLGVIFYLYVAAQLTAFWMLGGVRDERGTGTVHVFKGLIDLLRLRRYMLFLLSAFLIFGPMNGNNVYFGLLYDRLGGQIAGIGVAFLLFASSEAPFMKWSGRFINRIGLEQTILIAGLVSSLRWFWYGTAPKPELVLALFFLQGFSTGLYLVAGARFVRENTPDLLRVTALSVYTSMGLGLGSMASNLLGGIISDRYGILAVYTCFGILTAVGLLPLVVLAWMLPKREGEILLR